MGQALYFDTVGRQRGTSGQRTSSQKERQHKASGVCCYSRWPWWYLIFSSKQCFYWKCPNLVKIMSFQRQQRSAAEIWWTTQTPFPWNSDLQRKGEKILASIPKGKEKNKHCRPRRKSLDPATESVCKCWFNLAPDIDWRVLCTGFFW